MAGEFVADFINQCVTNGIQSMGDIRREAERQISAINEKIKEIEELKQQQNNLRAVVVHLGGSATQKINSVKMEDFATPWHLLEAGYKTYCLDIYKYISKNQGCFPREIMAAITDDLTEEKIVYSAIKWLWHHNHIIRGQNRSISLGEEKLMHDGK